MSNANILVLKEFVIFGGNSRVHTHNCDKILNLASSVGVQGNESPGRESIVNKVVHNRKVGVFGKC